MCPRCSRFPIVQQLSFSWFRPKCLKNKKLPRCPNYLFPPLFLFVLSVFLLFVFFSQRCCIVCCFGNWWLRSICSVYSTHFLFLKDAVCILVAFFVDFISLVDLHQQLIIISLNDDKKRGVCHCHPPKKSIAKLILSHFPQKSHPPNPKIHHFSTKKHHFSQKIIFFPWTKCGKNMSSPATNRRPLSTGPVDLVQPAVCAFQRSQRTSVDWWIYESDSWI